MVTVDVKHHERSRSALQVDQAHLSILPTPHSPTPFLQLFYILIFVSIRKCTKHISPLPLLATFQLFYVQDKIVLQIVPNMLFSI